LHRYLYAYSNPLSFIDPDGHAVVCVAGDCQEVPDEDVTEDDLSDPTAEVYYDEKEAAILKYEEKQITEESEDCSEAECVDEAPLQYYYRRAYWRHILPEKRADNAADSHEELPEYVALRKYNIFEEQGYTLVHKSELEPEFDGTCENVSEWEWVENTDVKYSFSNEGVFNKQISTQGLIPSYPLVELALTLGTGGASNLRHVRQTQKLEKAFAGSPSLPIIVRHQDHRKLTSKEGGERSRLCLWKRTTPPRIQKPRREPLGRPEWLLNPRNRRAGYLTLRFPASPEGGCSPQPTSIRSSSR
jgi:hypothetical protein